MKPEDAARLLGGYATGTLTKAERQALFQAAFASQELFNALGDEQALKELLDDPAARRRLLEALEEAKEPLLSRTAAWFTRPSTWALAGGATAAVLLGVIAVRSLVDMPRKQAIAMKTARPAASVPQAIEGRDKRKLAEDEPKVRTAPATVGRKDVAPRPAKESEAPAAAEFAAPSPPPPPAEERANLAAARQESIAPVGAQIPAAPSAKQAGARELYYREPAAEVAGAELGKAKPESAVAGPELKTAVVADVAAPVGPRPGLRYSVLREEPDGRYAEVDPRVVLQGGDRVRVTFEPDEDGHLYVLLRDAAGNWRLVFRSRVESRTRYSVPAEPIVLEGPAGEQRLLAMLSRTSVAEFESAGLRAAAPRLRDQTVRAKRAETNELDRITAVFRRESAESDLLVETAGETAPGKPGEKAVYMVAPRPGAGSRVVVEIPLRWR